MHKQPAFNRKIDGFKSLQTYNYENTKNKTRKTLCEVLLAGSLNDGPTKWEPSDEGRRQFIDVESFGKNHWPNDPNPYFYVLMYGKTSFHFLSTQYRDMFEKGDWWGFYMLWLDWEGDRWVLPYLCEWFKPVTNRELPNWLSDENFNEIDF